ncbi:MAG: hypothetical protein AAF413_02490 [Patescibacteria group bacterium]
MNKNRAKNSSSILPKLNALLIVGLAIFGGFFFYKYQQVKEDTPKTQQEIAEDLVREVGRIYELPTDETPEVATIEDISKLSGQAFFERAENGDKILIYQEAKQAFLYRESTKKVINAGPVAVSQQSEGLEAAGDQTETAEPQQEQVESTQQATTDAKVLISAPSDSLVSLSNQLADLISGGDVDTITNSTAGSNRIVVVNTDYLALATSIQDELGVSYGIDTTPSDSESEEPVDIIIFSTD